MAGRLGEIPDETKVSEIWFHLGEITLFYFHEIRNWLSCRDISRPVWRTQCPHWWRGLTSPRRESSSSLTAQFYLKRTYNWTHGKFKVTKNNNRWLWSCSTFISILASNKFEKRRISEVIMSRCFPLPWCSFVVYTTGEDFASGGVDLHHRRGIWFLWCTPPERILRPVV